MNPLVASLLLPLVGVAVIWAFADASRNRARWIALVTSLATLLLSAWVVRSFVTQGTTRRWLTTPPGSTPTVSRSTLPSAWTA